MGAQDGHLFAILQVLLACSLVSTVPVAVLVLVLGCYSRVMTVKDFAHGVTVHTWLTWLCH